MKEKIIEFLMTNMGYVKVSPIKVLSRISDVYNVQVHQKDLNLVKKVQRNLRLKNSSERTIISRKTSKSSKASKVDKDLQDFIQYKEIQKDKAKESAPKVCFLDIEVSPNLVFSWNTGRKISIDYENIVQERAIICICWKMQGDKQVHSLQWNSGDDKELLKEFSKVLESSDVVIGHNSNSFDLRWIRTRCLFHGIPLTNKMKEIDTLRISRSNYRFNSNRLDYISRYLNLGKKLDTSFDLWKDIVLKNDPKAMNTMITYCKKDVSLLEEVYNKLNICLPKKKLKFRK